MDGLTWRFALRANAVFHDGAPVTAAAAAASLNKAAKGAGVLNQAPMTAIEADGEKDVIIRLSRPFASLPAFLANYSAIVLAPRSYDDKGAVKEIIGSGAYRVASLTPPLRLELQRFDRWWGGRAAISGASYLAVGQGETRALMAESGEADVVFSILPVSVERLKRSPRLEVRQVAIPRTRMSKLNVGSPFFDDIRERRALSLALDRAGMARVILRNPEMAATNSSRPRSPAGTRPIFRRSGATSTRRVACSRRQAGRRAPMEPWSARDGASRSPCALSPPGPSCRRSPPPCRRSCARSAST